MAQWFVKGDVVVCNQGDGVEDGVTEGKHYTVSYQAGTLVTLASDDQGRERSYAPFRFRRVE